MGNEGLKEGLTAHRQLTNSTAINEDTMPWKVELKLVMVRYKKRKSCSAIHRECMYCISINSS